jgi:hypothetical protein
MKNNNLIKLTPVSLLLIFLLMISGCKKEDNTPAEDYTSTAEEVGQTESIATDVDNMTAQVSRTGTFTHENCQDPAADQFSFNSCAMVTNDSVNHILTFDFGTGCTGQDGRVRSGKVIVTYSGSGYFDPGASWTVTFDNFYVDGRHVEGTRIVTNNGLNANGNMTWTINAQNMRIIRPDGRWREWNSQRTREMIAGYGDSTWVNDIYIINGTETGSNSAGHSISLVLTNITRDHSCHWITSGTIAMTPNNRPVRTIDFGNGTCDDIATVTVNGNSRTIHLR